MSAIFGSVAHPALTQIWGAFNHGVSLCRDPSSLVMCAYLKRRTQPTERWTASDTTAAIAQSRNGVGRHVAVNNTSCKLCPRNMLDYLDGTSGFIGKYHKWAAQRNIPDFEKRRLHMAMTKAPARIICAVAHPACAIRLGTRSGCLQAAHPVHPLL